jgi:SAM-dependent methyltransferase
MVFKRLYCIANKLLLPKLLKRLKGYAYLAFFYGDLVGYENLIKILEREGIGKLRGDFIEIGSFIGGGTRKLAKYAMRFGKRVYAIDIFNPLTDFTTCEKGISMADIYTNILQNLGLAMFEAYWFNVGKYPNVVTIPKDSKKIKFPMNQQFAFGFIDGNHSPEYVINDFHLVWRHLVPGGIVAFHDYGYDLPEVTETINELIQYHKKDIDKIIINSVVHVIFIKKSQKSINNNSQLY